MARTIAFTGGGTMGPVAPLLALYKNLKKKDPDLNFVWAGTEEGPERQPIMDLGIEFVAIPTAKLSRYPSLRWLTMIFDYKKAKEAAKVFLDKYKPDIIIGAGGFTQVPVMLSAAKRGIPCIAHQLDFQPTLSNVVVSKHCKVITTSFVYHNRKFSKCPKELHIATPNRFVDQDAPDNASAKQYFGFDANQPLILFVGGGTGARALNLLVEQNLESWLGLAQVLQLTGKNRSNGLEERSGYVKKEFLNKTDMLYALSAADVIISRAGFGAISDFAALSKPVIIVPIPNSQQEKNSRHLPNAVIEIKEGQDFFKRAYKAASNLLHNHDKANFLGHELNKSIPTDDGEMLANIVLENLPQE